MIFFLFISEDVSYMISCSIAYLSRHLVKCNLTVVCYLHLTILIKLDKKPWLRTRKLAFKYDYEKSNFLSVCFLTYKIGGLNINAVSQFFPSKCGWGKQDWKCDACLSTCTKRNGVYRETMALRPWNNSSETLVCPCIYSWKLIKNYLFLAPTTEILIYEVWRGLGICIFGK